MLSSDNKHKYGELRWEKKRTENSSNASVRLDIVFSEPKSFSGLHYGQCINIFLSEDWVSTRVELANDWYLVGIDKPIDNLINKDVEILMWQH